jgi:AmmeMemoRadiSam system protein A
MSNQFGYYNVQDRQAILRIASMSALHGLQHDAPLPVNLMHFSPRLRENRAVFVTFNNNGQLRGCIGALQASRPLIHEVAIYAHAAVTRDPRFARVRPEELPGLDIHISVLTEPTQMAFSSLPDLLSQIRPDIDGLILHEGKYRGTFLPSVWRQIPDKSKFLDGLRAKAGLPSGYWSPTVQILRYQTETID